MVGAGPLECLSLSLSLPLFAAGCLPSKSGLAMVSDDYRPFRPGGRAAADGLRRPRRGAQGAGTGAALGAAADARHERG
eukprot:1770323-Prymnesium_polylepis.1